MLAGGGADLSFAVAGSERGSWVSVSSEGVVSGTPDSTNSPATVTIKATGTDGSTAQLTVSIPVRPSGGDAKLVERLRVLTYNLWHGGTQVNDYHAKQVRFLSEIDVDVVGLQETTGGHALRLANALGWHAIQGESVAVISRWPFGESHGNPITQGQGVRIAIDGDRQQVDFWNVHLGYTPYGPYDFCFDHMAVDAVLQREAESGRTGQIEATVAAMKASLDAADDVPVLLTGDFNAPSHLDWTEPAKDAHCGYFDVPWPTSKRPVDAGLADSFREAHPDPVDEPGITWSPIFLTNEGRDEPMDRIDFIYYKGSGLQVVSSESQLRGDPKPEPDHADNEWTSDHRAMLTEFALS
jgi:endonuclease/exonuclease/phosphatase family metal-dependent hydrolase